MCGSDAPRAPDYTQHNNNLLNTTRTGNSTRATSYNNAVTNFNRALTGGTFTTGGGTPTTTYTLPEITTSWGYTSDNNFGNGSGGTDRNRVQYWNVGGNRYTTEAAAKAWAEANKTATTTPGTGGKEQTVTGWNSKIGDFVKAVNGIGIQNLWDNPNTKDVNENAYTRLLERGNALKTAFAALTAPTAPELTKRVQGGGGQVLDITDLPELSQANMNLYNQLKGDLDAAFKRLDVLKGERATEENRVKGFLGDLRTDLAGYKTGLGQLSFGDLTGINALEREMSSLKAGRDGFSSSILGQMGGWGDINKTITEINQGVGRLRNQRTAEETRIANFEKGLLGQADTFRNGLTGLGIDDLDALTKLRDSIEGQQRAANRFSSVLGFDLSQELGELNSVYGKVTGLLSDRDTELDRIDTAKTGFKNDARSLSNMLANAGILDLSTINNYGDLIGDLRDDIEGFDSDLGADFSDIDLDALDKAFTELKGRRTTALNPFSTELGELGEGIGSFLLEDADGRADRIDDLTDLRAQLSSYTGSDVDGWRTQIDGFLKTLNDQSDDLTDKRTDLNTEAEDLLKAIKEGSYYDADDVATRRTEYDALKALVDQFDVDNASDEISAIDAFLNGQTSRLEADAQAQLAEQDRATRDANDMLAGNPIESMLGAQNLGDDEIRALLAMMAEEDDPMAQRLMGTFGQLVGA